MDIKAKYSRMVKTSFPEYGKSIKRKSYRNVIWFQLFILIIMFSGVLIFSQGFLLTRRAFENSNQCNLIKQGNLWNQKFNSTQMDSEIANISSNVEETCWYPQRFKKAVVLIIDALRYDFLRWEDDPEKIDPYFSNKLTIIHKLLTEQPNNAFQFQFKSDPPTTTMQRLKGLTTGTLPTFIDAGRNFAASAIIEDNLIKKIVTNGKRITFMGDDTWESLFDEYLDEKSIYCDSLNVWDLYSVDNKIKENLFPTLEQKEKDWDFLFAHFLGVDHCGHRYDPSNEYMDLKLREMNGVIEKVIEDIDDDTLLIVFGDHGMTEEGDHGGETENELNAGLFFYNKKGLINENSDKKFFENFINELKPIEIETEHEIYRTIPQIDFASTIALLFGLPIPFENIGSIIPELFWYPSPYGKSKNIESNILQNLMEAVRVNTYQIQTFVESYYASNRIVRDTATEKYQALEKKLQIFMENHKDGIFDNDNEELKSIILEYISHNRQTLVNFRQVWTKFNVPLFCFGLCILFLGIICEVIYLLSDHNIIDFNTTHHYWFPVGCGSIFTLLINYGIFEKVVKSIFGVTLTFEPYQMFLGGFSFGACLGYIISYLIKSEGRKSIINNIKSSIINNKVELFPIVLIFGHGILLNSDSYIIYEDSVVQYLLQSVGVYFLYNAFKQQIGQIRNRIILYTVLFMVIIRITSFFDLCRDERKGKCTTTIKTSITSYYLYLCSLIFFPYLLKKFINDNYYSISKPMLKYIIPVGLIAAALYWAIDTLEVLSALPKNLNYLTEVKYYTARYGYVVIPILALGIWAFFPITFESKIEPSKVNKNTNILNFYGIKNHLGSSYLLFLAIIAMAIIQVSKPISSLVVVLIFLALICMLQICALEKESNQIMESAEKVWKSKPEEEKKKLLQEMEKEKEEEAAMKNDENKNKNNKMDKDIGKIDANKYKYTLKAKDGQIMRLSHQELLEITYNNNSSSLDVPLVYALVASLLTLQIFFRTGHQSTLQSIDWSLAFIGQKDLNFIKAGFNLILNILSGEVLCCFFIPLFAFWKQETTNDNEKPMVKSICKAFIKYSVAYGFPQVISVMVAGTHKRHLMLWSVFAPRYMIGGITLCFIQAFCIIASIAIIFLVKGVSKYLEKIKDIQNTMKAQ